MTVTNAKVVTIPAEEAKIVAAFFGPDDRHDNDYTYYYNNIKENAAKRVAAYQASR